MAEIKQVTIRPILNTRVNNRLHRRFTDAFNCTEPIDDRFVVRSMELIDRHIDRRRQYLYIIVSTVINQEHHVIGVLHFR